MSDSLTERDVAAIAAYARIGMTPEELSDMTVDLNKIIATLEPITHFDLEGVEPIFHPIAGLVNVMRDDEVKASFTQHEALKNAPREEDGNFLIPSILGGGDN